MTTLEVGLLVALVLTTISSFGLHFLLHDTGKMCDEAIGHANDLLGMLRQSHSDLTSQLDAHVMREALDELARKEGAE